MYGFNVHKGGVSQTGIPHEQYTLITFSDARFNQGSIFNHSTGRVKPPAGLFMMMGQIWIQAGASGLYNPSFVAKIHKNGNDLDAGIGPIGSVPGTAPIPFSLVDLANGDDEYDVRLYASGILNPDTTRQTLTVDGHPAHTWFSGVSLS